MMDHEEIRDELQAEMESLLHRDERPPKTLDAATMRTAIGEIQLRQVVTVEPEATVEAAAEILIEHHQGCALVTDGDRVAGIFTERDVLTRVVGAGRDPVQTRVREVMSADPETLTPDHMLAYALNLMHMGGYRHVPIVDADGRPLGVLSVRDVLAYLADFFPEEVLTLPPQPSGSLPLYGG